MRKGRPESADVDGAVLLAVIYCGRRRVSWLRAAVIDVFGQFSLERVAFKQQKSIVFRKPVRMVTQTAACFLATN